MKCDRKTLRLYAITDRTWVGKQTLMEQVESALKGGATCIQLREKQLDDSAFLAEAMAMKKLCQEYGVPFIVNDNADSAVKCQANGVHLGPGDLPPQNVRALVGENMMIGVSARTVERAIQAEKAGADYLGVGAVFTTTTKPDAHSVSHDIVKEICKAVSIPVVAIGGISRQNILELSGIGIAGVALVSTIFASEDIEMESRTLRMLSEKIISA
ncbi:thiamine-phosphate pyrophosphorylase [Desulfosporosinus sp. Tol-M]|jgi:thiamine-phosphate pyrophosphorylase|nr:thiamine-phosphate pyrophosphorylase [Desulfosporosinus sp. Tol-M]